jgi:hypothetical protein
MVMVFFFDIYVSDCHNIISTVIKGEVLHEPKKLRYYRSYKTFDIENFNVLKQVGPLTSCDRLIPNVLRL